MFRAATDGFHLHPICFSRAEGSKIWDVDGNEYTDYLLGMGAVILGHAYPRIVEGKEQSTKFVKDLLREIELQLEGYLNEFPAEKRLESRWEVVRSKMLGIPLTERRLRVLRRIWGQYKNGRDWKKLIEELDQFLAQKGIQQREPIAPFVSERLRLVAIDFMS